MPHFRGQRRGGFIAIASTAGVRPRPGLTWYNGSMGAAIVTRRSMAAELAPDDIRVDVIDRVAGETGLPSRFMGGDTPELRVRFVSSIPRGRPSQPSDVAAAAMFFASDEAAFVTGDCLEVDGGRCVWRPRTRRSASPGAVPPSHVRLVLKPQQPATIVLLGALIAIAPLAMDIYLASMPSMGRALHAPAEAVQLTLSLYMYAWGGAQIVVGPLADRFGRRPVLIAGLLAFVVASLACAAARTVEWLIAARVAQAMAMATVAVVPRAVVRDLYAGDRAARVLSLMGMVLGIAPIVAPVLGSHLHVWFGWPSNFVFVAIYGAAAAACVTWGLPETLSARNAQATRVPVMLANYGRLLRSRRYVTYLLVAAFTASGLFAFLAGSAFVFVTVMGQGEKGFGTLFATVMIGNFLGSMLGSRLVTRWGIDRMIRRASWLMVAAGMALAALAIADVHHPAAIVVPMFFYMIALMMTMPQAMAGGLTPFPDIAGSASALLSFAQFLVASTTALVVGFAFDGTQRPMAVTIAVTAVLAFATFRLLLPRRPQHA